MLKILAIFYIYLALLGSYYNYLGEIETKQPVKQPRGQSFSVLAATSKFDESQKHVYGFLPYWMLNKTKYIQLDKLTDIAFFALHIERDGSIRKFDEFGNLDPGYNQWRNSEDFKGFKERAQSRGVRMSLTVLSHEDDISDAFLYCESCWPTLLEDIKEELDYAGIQNINLDFEYASYVDRETANQYTKLTRYLNTELDKEYGESYVVVSSFADSVKRPRLTNITGLGQAADGIFIMAYDFHVPTSDNAGPVSPIGGGGVNHEYDIATMVKDYVSVAPREKIILGVPYYGYNWVVYNSGPYAPRIEGNDYIGYSQSQTYEHVMDTILTYRPQILWDDVAKAPYFNYVSTSTGSLRQVYFENAESLSFKYDLIKSYDLGGVGIWALGYDGGYQELWELLGTNFMY